MSVAVSGRSAAAARLPARARLRRGLGLLGRVVFAVLLVGFVTAPLVGIVSSSITARPFWDFPPRGLTGAWFQQFFATKELIASTFVSLEAAVVVAVVGPVVATLTALSVTRSRMRHSTRDLIGVWTLIPLLLPTTALGLAIYLLYAFLSVPINLVTLGAAQVILVLPLVTGLLTIALDGIRPNTEWAAANLGAGTVSVLLRVTLPLLRPALVAAGIIAFVRSFDDSAIALFINSPDTTTLPIRMLLEMSENVGPLIAAAGSVLLLIAIALAFILDRVIGLSRAFGIESRER
jgi:putative spermidine/putrescine transport system permease protein